MNEELAELRERLAQLKAEREALEEAREQRDAEQRVRDELDEQETAIADERAIAAAVAEHGPLGRKIGALKTPGIGVVIIKRPHHVALRKWSDTNLGKDGAISQDALEQLVRPCVVHPDVATFDRYLQEQPVMLQRAGTVAMKLAGMRGSEVAGKS